MSTLTPVNRFFRQVTGLDPERVADCSTHFQRQVAIQGLIMLTTPLLAALLAGLGLGLTFQSLILGLVVGSLLCPLVYLAERATTTNLAPPGGLNWGLRILLFLGIVGLHLLSADLAFFDKEIRAEAERRYDVLRSDTLLKIDRQIANLSHQIAQYDHKIDSLQAEMARDQDRIFLEVEGLAGSGDKGVGKIAKWKAQNFAERRQTFYEPQFAAWNQNREPLLRGQDSLAVIRLAVANRSLPYATVGPGDRLSILHDLMGEEGGEGIWLLMLVILLLAAVSDFLPIVHRHTMDFDQYRAAHERSVSQRVGQQEAERNLALESARIWERSSIDQLAIAAEIEAQSHHLEVLTGSVERKSKFIARIYQARLNAARLIGKLHAQSFRNLSEAEQRAVEQAYAEALQQIETLMVESDAQIQFEP